VNLGSSRINNSLLNNVVELTQPLFPTATRRRLRYHDSVTITSNSGIPASYLLRANDLYDPDYTSTGHQPMGFDQMMVFFNHFVVLKAKLTCTFTTKSATYAKVWLRLDGNSASITDRDVLMEAGGYIVEELSYTGTHGSSKTLELSVDVAKYFSQHPSAITANALLTGDAATSPLDIIFLHMVVMDNINASSCPVVADFIIDYEAVFLEPRVPSLSRSLELAEFNNRRLANKRMDSDTKEPSDICSALCQCCSRLCKCDTNKGHLAHLKQGQY